MPSPCQKVCRLGPDEVCLGCHRTLDEIARWTSMSGTEKQSIWDRVGPRLSLDHPKDLLINDNLKIIE
ncbi:MAG: DUF1289 domain-containing protein [Armatimonadetes bacterium]|nr:DUF1289 domain-containing protein [Armatimonadota bacterium]